MKNLAKAAALYKFKYYTRDADYMQALPLPLSTMNNPQGTPFPISTTFT